MLNRLMITAATAALIAGTGFANAQGMNREAPSAGAGMQQSAPSSDRGSSAATPMNRDSAPEQGTKSTQSEEKMQPQGQPKGGKNQQTQGDMKSGPKGDKSAQDNNMNNNTKGDKSNNMRSETNDRGAAGKDMKAEDRNGNRNAESKGATDNKTVGQAGAGAKLSGEQRTKITTVIRNQHVAPVTNVNFSISVGTRVPRDVSFHPLPAEIVTIYPDWRGYEFILVNGQIVVIDPQSFEIVAVLDA
jgi:hypothetical protein